MRHHVFALLHFEGKVKVYTSQQTQYESGITRSCCMAAIYVSQMTTSKTMKLARLKVKLEIDMI